MRKTQDNTYYNSVGTYYDYDAPEFEKRYWKNPVLQRIRADFRTVVHKHPFENGIKAARGIDF